MLSIETWAWSGVSAASVWLIGPAVPSAFSLPPPGVFASTVKGMGDS